MKPLALVLLALLLTLPAQADLPASEVPASKQTDAGLYVTASEAWELWQADPDQVMILDVRTPEEFLFVGHAPPAWNVPVFAQSWEWDAVRGRFPMRPNPDFVAQVQGIADPGRTLLVICRSGNRSAHAVDLLVEAGFERVYSVVDGMEGDRLKDPSSPDDGKRVVNGWKNSGLPYTTSVDREHMVLPADQ